jgi:hypothetical protein
MSSVHNKQKTLAEEVDKLSNLPSCVISHILSFLPTKYAVRTSTLSSTWKNNWKTVTTLDFDSCVCYGYGQTYNMQASFVSFVYRVLLQLESFRLNTFRLPCDQDLEDSDATHIDSWISSALLHDVRQIEIGRTSVGNICFIPDGLFKCRTLVFLHLSEGCLKIPDSVCLPNLKVLHLEHIEFLGGDSVSRLVSGAPLLIDLMLDSCVFFNTSVIKISSPRLIKLLLLSNGISRLPNYRFVLDAPQLEFLDFSDYSPEQGMLKKLQSLVVACIDFKWNFCARKEVFNDFKTKSLVFRNLKTLNYWVRDVYGCSLMKDIVECSPQLETIYLDFDSPMPLEKLTHNICKLLKQVEFYSFEGSAEQMEFVKYILANSNALKIFLIYWESYSAEIEVKVLNFPRASTSSKIVFLDD